MTRRHPPPGAILRFDVYGRLLIEVVRTGGRWNVYEVSSEGKRRGAGVRLAPDTPIEAILDLLDAYFHEMARPGTVIKRIK